MEDTLRDELECGQNCLEDRKLGSIAQLPSRVQSAVPIEYLREPDAVIPQDRDQRNNDNDDAVAQIAEARDEKQKDVLDEQRTGLFYVLRSALRRRFTSFAQEVSVPYVSHLVEPSPNGTGSAGRKKLWAFLLFFGLGFMTYQFYDRISYYLSCPTTSDYQMAYSASLPFPSVTICPEIRVSRERVSGVFG